MARWVAGGNGGGGGAAAGTPTRRHLMAAAEAAWGQAPADRAVHPAPPTITTGTATLDAALTNAYVFPTHSAILRVLGGEPVGIGGGQFRMAVVTLPDGSAGNVSGTSRQANKWAIEFMTDAASVQFHFTAGSGLPGYVFEVDGQRATAEPTPQPATSGNTYYLLAFGSSKTRRVRVWGQANGTFKGVAVKPTEKLWPTPAPLRLAVVGDSIVAGTGAEARPDGAWASLLGQRLGWEDVRQVAIGGTGFVTAARGSTIGDATRVADLVAAPPDLIITTLSPNDASQTPSAVGGAVAAALAAFRAACPGVPIILGGQFPGTGTTTNPANYLAIEQEAKAAFDAWSDSLKFWVPVLTAPEGAWITGTGRDGAPNGSGNSDVYVGTDDVHPTLAGHNYHALRWEAAIRSHVLPHL